MIQNEMESLTKELLLSPGAVEGSEPSAQQDRSGRLEEIGTSKDASAQTVKPQSRETVGSRASVGPAGQTFTDPPREKRSPNEKAKDREDKGEFTSEDRNGGLSQSPGLTTGRSAQETSSKDEEEVDPGRAIDWLLQKRGDKK